MKLDKKKALTVRTLGVGSSRIIFNKERLGEIKDAITKQDIRDLLKDKAITVREIKGRKKLVKRSTRRRAGSVRKKVNKSKQEYVILTRKLRKFIKELRKKEILDSVSYRKLRKEIRAKDFRSKSHLKEHIFKMIKEKEE